MKNKKIIIATTAMLLAISLIFSGCSLSMTGKADKAASENAPNNSASDAVKDEPQSTQKYKKKPNSVRKAETVYANLDNGGNVKTISVSDWIHTDIGEVAVADISDLKNIVNVKSNEKLQKKGNALTWHMPTTDLYYKGESDKQLPVTISIKYFLDDKEMTAEEIAGKSGKVRIAIEMKNNLCKTKKIGGKDVKIYSPLVVVGGMVLPEEKFSAVNVENGKSMGDGTKELAIMLSFPGISETLGIKNIDLGKDMPAINFAENFNITATTTNFSLDNIYFGVIPLSALGEEIKIPTSINEIGAALSKLKELQEVITQIDPNNILGALMQTPDKITNLVTMIDEAVGLYEQNKALLELLPKYMTAENMEAINKLTSTENGNSSLNEMLTLLSNPVVQTFLKLLPAASQDMMDILPMMQDLSKDLEKPEIKKSLDNLPQTIESLNNLEGQLKENTELINQLTSIMNEKNIDKLKGVLESGNTKEFSEMLKKYGILMENSDELIDRVGAMLEMANEYKIYSSASQNMRSSVMFVYQTPSIKIPPVEKPIEKVEEISWFQKVINRFKK
ncbi:MAG: hypothetical protein RR552_04900 [Oscillospiraceae bacterium]